ncbi:hypothetical protein [Bradyrhizobium lablabi]|nr:hypothetical protein [Bradyrhizobium lablabi]
MLDNPGKVSRWRGTASIPHQQTQEERMRKSLAVFLSGVALTIAASTALAGEQVLEFKLIVKPIDVKVTEAANVEGQTVMSGKFFGVTVFKDGRIGVKEFVHSADSLKGSGPYYGYSTYTFEDGSITARYTGAVKDGRSNGEYTILSGTGAYANATGTGTIESAPNPFKGVNLLNIKLVVRTPGT